MTNYRRTELRWKLSRSALCCAFYGTEAEMEKLHESYDPYQSRYSYISGHRTLAAAKAKAEKLACRDRRDSPKHELCHISADPFSDYLG